MFREMNYILLLRMQKKDTVVKKKKKKKKKKRNKAREFLSIFPFFCMITPMHRSVKVHTHKGRGKNVSGPHGGRTHDLCVISTAL